MSGRLLIVCWHNVTPTWFFPSPPDRRLRGLVAQARLLRRLASPIALEDALDTMFDGRPLPPRAVALTFDDGYRDNLELAAPALSDLGLSAGYYLVSGFLDGEAAPWWERMAWAFARSPRRRLRWRDRTIAGGSAPGERPDFWPLAEELKRCDRADRDRAIDELIDLLEPRGDEPSWADMFVDWDGARQLARVGEIGCHTRYHGILSEESAASQADEIAHACGRLRDELDRPIRTLAYPNGTGADYDEGSIAAAAGAGLDYALTTTPAAATRDSRPFEIERLVLDPITGRRGLRAALRVPGALAWLRGA